MCIWDEKWLEELKRLNIRTELNVRYMDDGRSWLHTIKKGWRLENGELTFCKEWEERDEDTPVARTERILKETMNGLIKGKL